MTNLFRMEDHGSVHVHLDMVAPLPASPDGTTVVLRIDVVSSLYAFLQDWPVPSTSAETLLFKRESEAVLFLNELRHEKNTALTKRIPFTAQSVLAVQALAPDYRPGTLIEGVDYRGMPTLGVGQSVAGAPWPIRTTARWSGEGGIERHFIIVHGKKGNGLRYDGRV